MHKNETKLTPVFRFIINRLEKYKQDENDNIFLDIEHFINSILEENETMLYSNKIILKKVSGLLDEYRQDENTYAREYWNNTLSEIRDFECSNCSICKNCMLYFWYELGEVMFEIPNEYKLQREYIPLRTIPDRIFRHLEPTVDLKDIYNNRNTKTFKETEDYILILKGMSSSTPSILNSAFDTDEFDGGGIYIRYKGIGIVIDPGYHFIRNFHHYGQKITDIDFVIVTHEHIDHNQDMRLIDDLNASISKDHKIIWMMDEVSYSIAMIYQNSETGFIKEQNTLIKVDTTVDIKLSDYMDEIAGIEEILKFSFFKTEHIFDKDETLKKHTFGCKIDFLSDNQSLAYTSDTRYFEQLSHYLNNANIIIANISGIYEDDYMLVKPKDRHLGYYGCYSILKDCYEIYKKTPSLFLLSEFWNGQSDIRYDVAKQMQENIRNLGISNTHIVPAEKGMFVRIKDSKIRCNQCGNYNEKYLIKRPFNLTEKVEVLCLDCCYG